MTIKLSSFGSGSSGVTLAPDLTFPSTRSSGSAYIQQSIDATGGLTEVLNLTGKFVIDAILYSGLTAETVTHKLTIDGVVIWDDTFTSSAVFQPLGFIDGTNVSASMAPITCNSSLLLEFQTATDPNVVVRTIVRPIL